MNRDPPGGMADIDRGTGELTVVGKGNKKRTVYMEVASRRALWRYMETERVEASPEEPLFVPRAGEAQAVLNPAYLLTDLGTLGGAESEARAVNNHDEVVGWAETEAFDAHGKPIRHAFVWDATNGVSDLGTTGGSRSEANDINDSGQVVGWSERLAGRSGVGRPAAPLRRTGPNFGVSFAVT